MAAYTTINDPSAFFKCQLYTGNGSANHAITFDDTDTDMQPDLVWIKNRDATDAHCLFDAVRGATKVLHPNTYDVEATDADTLDSFTSDGFQVDADVKVNTNAEKYASWNWKANGSGSSNTDGSINTASTSVDTTAGFSISKYIGTGSNGTIGHGLGVVPKIYIIKNLDSSGKWWFFPSFLGDAAKYLDGFGGVAATGSMQTDGNGLTNSTLPTSSLISIGTSSTVNISSDNIMCYAFAEKQGYSKFGEYTGNGNNDGTFVYTGFKPAFLLVKPTSADGSWNIYDNKRLGYNDDNNQLYADLTNAEGTDDAALLSNGFKWTANTGDPNSSGRTYIYMAFAEAPFVNSNEVPCNAR